MHLLASPAELKNLNEAWMFTKDFMLSVVDNFETEFVKNTFLPVLVPIRFFDESNVRIIHISIALIENSPFHVIALYFTRTIASQTTL